MIELSVRDLFRELEGTTYPDYRTMQEAVLNLFNRHVRAFPPRYSYLQLIAWGEEQGWIRPTGDGCYRIELQEPTPTA